jgi:hypothetical protein
MGRYRNVGRWQLLGRWFWKGLAGQHGLRFEATGLVLQLTSYNLLATPNYSQHTSPKSGFSFQLYFSFSTGQTLQIVIRTGDFYLFRISHIYILTSTTSLLQPHFYNLTSTTLPLQPRPYNLALTTSPLQPRPYNLAIITSPFYPRLHIITLTSSQLHPLNYILSITSSQLHPLNYILSITFRYHKLTNSKSLRLFNSHVLGFLERHPVSVSQPYILAILLII